MKSILTSKITLFSLRLIPIAALVIVTLANREVASQEVPQSVGFKATSDKEREREAVDILLDGNLRGSSPQRVLEALSEISSLGCHHVTVSEDKIEIVSRYLDFRRDEASNNGNMTNKLNSNIHPLLPGDIYPAVEALTCIGPASHPVMVEVIEKEESGSLRSQNAMWVVLLFHSGDFQDAVNYFNKAAEGSTNANGKERLRQVANKITGYILAAGF